MTLQTATSITQSVHTMIKRVYALAFGGQGERASLIEDPILLHSATDLARMIRHREVTSLEVVKAFIARICDTNRTFNFMVDDAFAESIEEARLVDERLANGGESPEDIEKSHPFLGVPFTFKASIAKTGFRCTAGLRSRNGVISDEDADVITYMRRAGAIPVASTNISELCLWWESYNILHGQTKNPYNSRCGVGGSSGGEGCVLGLGGSPMGIGSDVGGSIRIPAHFNGVFGHKPTNGVGSLKGHYPHPRYPTIQPFLVIGPMSRYAKDLLSMYKVIAGDRAKDLKLDEPVDVSKLKYYYMEDDNGSIGISPVDPEIKDGVRRVVRYLKNTYGIEAKKLNLEGLGYSMLLWVASMKTPAGPLVCGELAGGEGTKNAFWELVKYGFGVRDHTLPVLVIAAMEQMSMRYGDKRHAFFMKMAARLKAEFEGILGSDGVFIYPTLPTAAPYHGEPFLSPFDVAYTALFNWLGYPATHCPMGLNSQGLPIGVQVAAREMQDRLTLAVALELEKAFGGWFPPGHS